MTKLFFIGIFGIDSKKKDIGLVPNLPCKSCKTSSIHIIKQFSCFHFFFIPLIKWNEMYIAECSQCHSLYEVPAEKGKAFEKHGNDLSYWDLKSLKVSSVPKACSACGKTIEEDFAYCPYCGQSVKDE